MNRHGHSVGNHDTIRGHVIARAAMIRGGSSRGLIFLDSDLPVDPDQRDAFILGAYGSPDEYGTQVDDMGGGTSTTSKVGIVGGSSDPDYNITYEFGQVAVDRPVIDRRGTCGNLSAAIGPFALLRGTVQAQLDTTRIRILIRNTNKLLVAQIPTPEARFSPGGDLRIPGVRGTGAPIQLDFHDPAGAVTGKLLPTGSSRDVLEVPGVASVEVSIVDAANPLVFVPWHEGTLGPAGDESELTEVAEILERLERIRATAAVACGIADDARSASLESPAVPKLALVGRPVDYSTARARASESQIDVRMTMLSMGRPHPSIALTGAICTAVAARIDDTVVANLAGPLEGDLRIGHPAGVMSVKASVEKRPGKEWVVASVSSLRTARLLMDNWVHVAGTNGEIVDAACEVDSP